VFVVPQLRLVGAFAHDEQLELYDLHSSTGVGGAHVPLLGHTHPADAEHVVDAAELDCWHAAEEDADELLPDEQYSEWTQEEKHARKKRDNRVSARIDLTR
jgi:hypothetical protein